MAALPLTGLSQNWQEKAIAPVTDPIFFESALIQSEVRPLFAYHTVDKDMLGVNADVRVYAVQLRYAVNDKLAIIATKDGYIEFRPDHKAVKNQSGWADVGAGIKYALYRNDDQQVQITPGFTFEFPTGRHEVFQGNGDGEWNLFVSAVKGFDNLHVTLNVGARIPNNFNEETANVRYAGMIDYYTCQYFIPFVTINGFTTVSETDGNAGLKGVRGLDSEGFDLINYGSSRAKGKTQLAAGIGFRSRLVKSLDVGVAYENGFTPTDDIFRDRLTVDFVWRF